MAEEQRELVKVLWWLTGELRAGKTFSDEKLRAWELRAEKVLQETMQPVQLPPTIVERKAWQETAYASLVRENR